MRHRLLQLLGGFCLYTALIGWGCKELPEHSLAALNEPHATGSVERESSDGEMIQDIGDFYYQVFQTPYMTNWKELSKYSSGEVESTRVPYTDSWYPEKTGGTNALSAEDQARSPRPLGALSRYDLAFNNGNSLAVTWESQNHNDQQISWFGHCNGFSVAASRHQNPTKSVVRPEGCQQNNPSSCVTFEPKHIRALLAEVYMSAKARFISGQRCRADQITMNPENREPPTTMGECEDVNPGSFHIAMVNWIARQKQVLVFDYNRNQEVWNFPFYRYSYTLENGGQRLSRAQAIQETGRAGAADYVFNPNATSFLKVRTIVTFAKVHAVPKDTVEAPTEPVTEEYLYLLELDDQDNVLGGEWLSDSRLEHPDFVWMPFEPFKPDGSRKYGNPHVNADEVIKMWAESAGFDPNDPFNDPKNPNRVLKSMPAGEDWGLKQGLYQVSLDGGTSGAVFLGKKITGKIDDRRLDVRGDVSVDVFLNDKPYITLTGTGVQPLEFELDPVRIGMNSLEFRWKGGSIADSGNVDLKLRFYAFP